MKNFISGKWSFGGILPYLIILITVGIFLPSLNFGFHNLDDTHYVVNNEYIRSFSWFNIKSWFEKQYVALWIPMTIASYSLDYMIWGISPFGYHLTNLILHLINIFLVFSYFRRFNFSIFVVCFVTCIFAFHPVQVESVVWISERKNLLSFLFFMLSMHSWKSWIENNISYKALITAIFFVFSLLSKPAFVLGPVLFAIQAVTFSGRIDGNQKKYYFINTVVFTVFIVGSIVSILMTLKFHVDAGGLNLPLGYTKTERFFTTLTLPWYYFKNLIYPLNLSPYYLPSTMSSPFHFKVGFGVLTLFLYFYCCLKKILKPDGSLLWLAWFAVTILPVSTVVVEIYTWMNDRYMYMPIPVIALLFAGIINKSDSRLKYFSLIVLIPMIPITVSQVNLWRDSEHLLKTAIQRHPEAYQAKKCLLNYYMMKRDFERSEPLCEEVLKLEPIDGYVNFCKIMNLNKNNNHEEAFEIAKYAQKYNPKSASLNRICGYYYMLLGQYKKASEFYIKIPDDNDYESSQALLEQIQVLTVRGDFDIAASVATEGIKRIPHKSEIYRLYARILTKQNKPHEALNVLMEGVKRHVMDGSLRQLLIETADILAAENRKE